MPLKDDYIHQILHIQIQYKKYIQADHMVPPGSVRPRTMPCQTLNGDFDREVKCRDIYKL